MSVATQLTAILPNRASALADLCDVLRGAGVRVIALCVVDTADYGLARFVADDPLGARRTLDEAGIPCGETPVVVLETTKPPRSLGEAARRLAQHKVELSYVYAGVPEAGRAVAVLGVSDPHKAAAILGSA